MKQRTNAWINIAAFVAGLASLVTGIVLWLAPSGGYRGGRGAAAISGGLVINHELWRDLHIWTSLVLVVLVLVHLIAHWAWIKKLPKLMGRKRPNVALARRTRDSGEAACAATISQ
jgi:hypothetical protein